jgi:hypothetical protein
MHDDVEWSEPPDQPDPKTWSGHEGVTRSIRSWAGAWDGYRIEPVGLADIGKGQVLAHIMQSGRGKGSGVEISEEQYQLWTLREGKAARLQMFRSRDEALRAALADGR